MVFLPTQTPAPPSPRVLDLAQRLSSAVERFRQEHTDVSEAEIRQAIHLAASSAGATGSGPPAARVLAVLAGLGAAALGAGLAVNRGGMLQDVPWAAVGLVAAGAVVVVLVLLRARSW